MKLKPLDKKGVDWQSPQTLVVIILAMILIALFFMFLWQKVGTILKP